MVTRQLLSSFTALALLWILSSGHHILVHCASDHHNHRHHHHHHRHRSHPHRLFVFGDSYADTGNDPIALTSSWKVPYGITFPGKPSGRFSDGRVLTDFVARYVGLRSPIPYKWREVGAKYVKYGMNFAFGGTGVFETLVPLPNMTAQIDFLQQLVANSVYTKSELETSLALVTLAGNDYSTYLAINGSLAGLPSFITQVVKQLTVDLKRIHDLGVKKVAVGSLQPLGCLPRFTYPNSFKECNATINSLVVFHNQLLKQAVSTLNNQTESSAFVIIDLYDSFLSVINNKGSGKFENPLAPCCVGINSTYSCASVDASGNKLYTLCEDRKAKMFWDFDHPTQEGWQAVYSLLGDSLEQL